MKKIVFVLSHFPNPRIIKRIDTLKEKFDITLIYWNRLVYDEKFSVDDRINVVQVTIKAPIGNPFKRVFPLWKFKCRVEKHLKIINPDFLHIANLDMLLVTEKYVHKHKKVKTVYEIGDLGKYVFYKQNKFPKKTIYKYLVKKETKIMSNSVENLIITSPYFFEKYYKNLFDANKTLFIPNVPRKKVFSSYSKKENKTFTIGFIGSVRYYQNLVDLIEATNKSNYKINILIAGSGPSYKAIKEYIELNNIVNVEMYGPYNYQKDIVSLYERIDIVYSLYDANNENVKIALPNRLYEAINCELPIIVAKNTVLSDFVEKEKIGLSINSSDCSELQDTIEEIIKNNKLYDSFRVNAKNIKHKYQYEFYESKLMQIYLES